MMFPVAHRALRTLRWAPVGLALVFAGHAPIEAPQPAAFALSSAADASPSRATCKKKRRRRRPKRRRARRRTPAPAPAATPAPAASGSESDLVPSTSFRGPTRIDFDDRLIQGQTNKSGAVYLFDRKETGISSMVKRRKSFRRLTIQTVYDR